MDSLLITSFLFPLPLKTFPLQQLYRAPFYLLDGMPPDSCITQYRQFDLLDYSAEFLLLNMLIGGSDGIPREPPCGIQGQ